jgi:hypothetical protein
MRMTPKWDMKDMSSRRESMCYDFSQMGPDNGQYKGVESWRARILFSTSFSEVNMESKTDTILTIPR